MRLFSAIELPDAARADLAATIRDAKRTAPALPWVSPGNWHLTLAYYGRVDVGVERRLRERLDAEAAQHKTLTLRLQGAGTFPGGVLWAGVGGDVHGLADLARGARAVTGSTNGDEPFRPHVTLARAARADLKPVAPMLNDLQTRPWRVEHVALVSSTGGPSPRYDVIDRWKLSSCGS